MVIKIISTGQTGVERAALDVAMENDIAIGGYCPKGRAAEDGVIPAKYPLVESDFPAPHKAAESNVIDSDGTLIISWGALPKTTLKVAALAARLKKPVYMADLKKEVKLEEVEAWAVRCNTKVLNIVGPSAAEAPNAYDDAKAFLLKLLIGDGTTPSPEE